MTAYGHSGLHESSVRCKNFILNKVGTTKPRRQSCYATSSQCSPFHEHKLIKSHLCIGLYCRHILPLSTRKYRSWRQRFDDHQSASVPLEGRKASRPPTISKRRFMSSGDSSGSTSLWTRATAATAVGSACPYGTGSLFAGPPLPVRDARPVSPSITISCRKSKRQLTV